MAELIQAGDFATKGEEQAAHVLQQLPKDWIVICNKLLPRGDRSHEIDFIVIGSRWVFLLDEKSWRGQIWGNDQLWVRADGTSMRSPLAKVDYVAKVLAGHISWKVSLLKDSGYFVHSGVLLSIADQLPQIHDSRASNGIFLLKDVCERLLALDSHGGNSLVGTWRPQIKQALVDLSQRPTVPKKIGVWMIEEASILRPGVRLCKAKMEDDPDQLRQLMVYDLSKDPLETRELRTFYMHECIALQKLSITNLVPRVESPFPWSDDFLVMPIVPPSGKSLSAYPRSETRDEYAQELLLASSCFKALDQIHSQNVLHRAIGPDTIYVQGGSGGQTPKVVFTNFYAARVGTNSIAASLDALSIEDPYAHIDLALGYGNATKETDTFSLALVFLERLSGISLSNIRASVELAIIFPELQIWPSFLSTELVSELSTLLKQTLLPEKGMVPPHAREVATSLGNLARRLRTEPGDETIEGRILDKRYKIHRLLGRGTMARTYLASDTDFESFGLLALKQYINPEEVLSQAEAEFGAMKVLRSKYFPHIHDIFRSDNDVHVKMDYIPGQTLQQYEAEFPWQIDRWWVFAQQLLEAVEILEQKQLLHRDIKPANIILHEDDNHPVLIDFGFAIRQGATARMAGSPLYLPPEALSLANTTIPASCDRYAVGIILFKVLLGYLPFTLTNGIQRYPVSLAQIIDEKVRRVATVLLKTVSNNPTERQITIGQIRQELQQALLEVEALPPVDASREEINPWVNDIRSLYRNSEVGNQNNRGLDSDFVRATYVNTALDNALLPAIFELRPKVVFLCGNPGDGKTAFLEQVQKVLRSKAARLVKQDLSGWEWELDGHIYRSCYDASESHEKLTADQQLTEKLQGLEGRSKPDAALTVLVAINDGRLADYFRRERDYFYWLARQIEQVRDASEVVYLDVWVIDLKKRAFVNLPDTKSDSVFRQVLQRLVVAEEWRVCDSCAAQAVCPMRNNALALRKGRIVQRLEYLFLLAHLRRQRHTTMRDLRSALAYLITGNKSCQQVHDARHEADAGASLIKFAYWQSSFAPEEQFDEVLTDLRPFDPARFPHPHLDRFLHFHQAAKDGELRGLLFADKSDLPLQRFANETEWIAAYKRRLYFEATKAGVVQENPRVALPKVRWLQMLPYQYAKGYMELLDDRLDDDAKNELRERLALGLLRSDAIIEDVPAGKLSVKVNASTAQQLVVLKQLPLEEFKLSVDYPPGTRIVEMLPEIVVLQHVSGLPRLVITMDMFELLMRMADGLQPTAPEFKPLLDDLKLFKDRLLLSETRDLVLIENQHRVHLVTQQGGKIARTRLS